MKGRTQAVWWTGTNGSQAHIQIDYIAVCALHRIFTC